MKAINTKINSHKIIGEVYESPREVIDILGKRPRVFDERDFFDDNYECRDPEFYGFTDGKQLKADFLENKVDEKTLTSIKMALRPSETYVRKIRFHNDVLGFAPNVPNYLMNLPYTMINQHIVPIKYKVINLNVEVGASSYWSTEQLADAGRRIFAVIMGLEESGYRVNLMAYSSHVTGNEIAYMGLKLKDSSQPMDVARCAFPFINPAYMRGIGFAWYQRTDGFRHAIGYGHPISNNAEIEAFQTSIDAKNSVFVHITDILHNGDKALESALTSINYKPNLV